MVPSLSNIHGVGLLAVAITNLPHKFCVGLASADAASAIVVLLGDGAGRVVQNRTAEMRLIACVSGCRCHSCCAEHVRIDCNAQGRARGFGDDFPN